MGCFKTFVFSQAAIGEAALQDAVYVTSTDKIYATSGVHVLAFNASTGVLETSVRVASPVNGTARLAHHDIDDMLYVSVWNEPNNQYFSLTHPGRDVYPVNPATMAVGARLNLSSTSLVDNEFTSGSYFGPRWVGSSGDYLYVQWARDNGGYNMLRVNPSNLADRCTQAYFTGVFLVDQIALTPTQIMVPSPDDTALMFAPIGYNTNAQWDYCDIPPYYPVAAEYCPSDGLVYATDGEGNLFRINDPSTDDFTVFDLTAIDPAATPVRLRYSTVTQKIYLPNMLSDSVIVWDPNTASGSLVVGFENPVDIVTAGSKIWAVQNSPDTPLLEIT